jgi:catechol 2,3-dioxygenase-like lactoylglutathione lyase family enzyme
MVEGTAVSEETATLDVVALRPFVPATDFETSIRFYVDLGFAATRHGDAIASMQLGAFGFLLQKFYAEGFAGNFMMQMLVHDIEGWWKRIESLDMATKYGVRAPKAPAVQPWGLTVSYVVDPSGVLWHIAKNPN